MTTFNVPTREEVSANNQTIFDQLNKGLGFVPNLYAYYAKSETALADYLALQNRKTTLKAKEKEVVNLVVSQVNGCQYCLSAHTALGKMNGFSEEQIMELRGGSASFDAKLDALVKLAKNIAENKGNNAGQAIQNFYDNGYTEVNLIDVVMLIGDKIISNYINNITNIPVDFPAAQPLQSSVEA